MATVHTLPNVIFFDWDGTIADNSIEMDLAFARAALVNGIPRSVVMSAIGRRGGLINNIYKVGKEKVFDASFNNALDIYQKVVHPVPYKMPGIEDFLNAIKSIDIPIIIVSNRETESLIDECKSYSFEYYFKGIYGSTSFNIVKPDHNFLLKAAEDCGISFKTAWMFGDSSTDLMVAYNLSNYGKKTNIFFCGSRGNLYHDEEGILNGMLQDGGAEFIDYKEIIHILEGSKKHAKYT